MPFVATRFANICLSLLPDLLDPPPLRDDRPRPDRRPGQAGADLWGHRPVPGAVQGPVHVLNVQKGVQRLGLLQFSNLLIFIFDFFWEVEVFSYFWVQDVGLDSECFPHRVQPFVLVQPLLNLMKKKSNLEK